jgi:hypothetical protein
MAHPKLIKAIRVITLAGALAVAFGAAGQAALAGDGGIRNCVDITRKQFNRVGCYEKVWAGGVEYRMTFSNTTFSGNTPGDLDPFYVTGPQGAVAQGPVPTFPHDHTVTAIPKGNGGTLTTKLQGFFVLCSGQGLISGACDATWMTPVGTNPLPFANTVHGQHLTSVEAIEVAAAAGDVALVNLGPEAVIVGSISGH